MTRLRLRDARLRKVRPFLRAYRVSLEPIVDCDVEAAGRCEGLDLVVPVRGEDEGVAGVELNDERRRSRK